MRYRLLLTLLFLLLAAPARAQQTAAGEMTPIYLPLVAGMPAVANNLYITSSTYLGGSGVDTASAVAIADDLTILVAGSFPALTAPSAESYTLIDGPGTIIRLDSQGRSILSITRMGTVINDMEMGPSSRPVICGDFGVAVMRPTLDAVVWRATPGVVLRCAIGSDGTVAALVGNNVLIYSALGAQMISFSAGGTLAYDVAVSDESQRAIVTGYAQADGQPCGQLQIAYLRAYDYTGALAWQDYSFTNDQAGAANLCADTRGERVTIGAEGKLYLVGSINGGTGESVFAREPRAFDTALPDFKRVSTDSFTDPFNVGSVKTAWFGRFDPANGALEVSQTLLTRLRTNNKGNSISIRAIAVDNVGRVVITGDAACCIRDRDTRAIANLTVGSYESGEAFYMALSPDLRTRSVWTTFARPGMSAGGSPGTAIALRNGRAVLVGNFTQKVDTARGIITVAPLQEVPVGDGDAMLMVIPQ